MRRFVLGCSLALCFVVRLQGQSFSTGPCESDHDGGGEGVWFSGHQARTCELRRATLALEDGQVNVVGINGGIEVIGEDRRDIALEAEVRAQAGSRGEAESIVREVSILTKGTIEAKGPTLPGSSRANWSVSFRLRVPRQVSARLKTMNGAISVVHVEGRLDAQTTNGGLDLRDLAGDVRASTVNGGVDVRLAGNRWLGSGLVAKTTNGGISVAALEHYSAHLTAETVHGGVAVNFPITVKGVIGNQIDTDLGQGGAPLRFETVNGGVSISKK